MPPKPAQRGSSPAIADVGDSLRIWTEHRKDWSLRICREWWPTRADSECSDRLRNHWLPHPWQEPCRLPWQHLRQGSSCEESCGAPHSIHVPGCRVPAGWPRSFPERVECAPTSFFDLTSI